MNDGLYQVTTAWLCAGIVVAGGRVTGAAPILRWAVGGPIGQVAAWARRRGGTCARVAD